MNGALQSLQPDPARCLQLLVDAIEDHAFYMLDLQGAVLTWNAGARLNKGYSEAEVIGQRFHLFFRPEDVRLGEPEALLARAAAEGTLVSQGWRLRRDGTAFWARITLTLLRDAAGRPCGFATTSRDLTEARLQQDVLRASEDRFRSTMHSAAIGMVLVGLDGRFWQVNRAICDLLGYAPEELREMTFQQVSHPAELEQDLICVTALLSGRIESYHLEKRYLHKDGRTVWGRLTVSLIRDQQGVPQYFISQIQDIDQRKAAEAALQEAHERLQVTLHSIADGVIATDAQGRIGFINPAACAMTGWEAEEAAGQPIETIFSLADATEGHPLPNPVRAALAADAVRRSAQPPVLLVRDGTRLDVQDSAAPLHARDGSTIGAVLVFQNLGAVLNMRRQLEFSTQHDALTGLPNRQTFEALLVDTVRAARQDGRQHALCFLNLDRFKIVNDTAGHGAGDALLRMVTRSLRLGLRKQDRLARLGGDEFAIILYDCTMADAVPQLERLADALAVLQFPWDGKVYNVTASIGVAAIDARVESAYVAMKQADIARHAAKQQGRNRVSLHGGEVGAAGEAHRGIIMASQLRQALEEGRFRLHAQKITALQKAPTPRFELLLRMIDRNGAMVPPADFIPVAERYDLMSELDRWVLQEVLQRHAPALVRIPQLELNINISANSLNDTRFLPFFLELLEASPLPPAVVTLEITETALINNLNTASGIIDRIRAAGCRIALDDFGIGLSSFGYLRAFRVDCIKIEGSFVRNICESAIDLAIVKSINGIAQEISAETVAEFVEDEAILQRLREIGVDYAQGYAIGRPQDLGEVIAELDPAMAAMAPARAAP
jgi:diguanylate cyclase (GGDEF)-like protein/PAS domain S-box-containing protein